MIATKLLALVLMAALNPLVARAPEPRGNAPDDCAVSDAAPMTRIAALDIDRVSADEPAAALPAVRPVAKKTTGASSTAVADLKRALAANDRPAFDAALRQAREDGVATRVYDDIARLWDAQFESPFFAEDSDAYRVASSYPGYAEAVRRQIFTDDSGKKFFPAAESRAFIAMQVGIRSAPPATRAAVRTPAPAKTTTTTKSTRTASRKPAASRKKAPPRSPDPSPAPKIAAAEPAPAVSKVVDTSSTEAPPAAGIVEPVAEPAPAPPVVADTMATDTATTDTTPTDTTSTFVSDTATTTTAPAPATTGAARPILIPAILILIGLGVLILLFRTKA